MTIPDLKIFIPPSPVGAKHSSIKQSGWVVVYKEVRKKKISKEKARRLIDSGPYYKIRHRPTLPPVTAIPSALAGLTTLFGMERGGHRRYRHLNTCDTR